MSVSTRSHRADRDAPIESSVAQMGAELFVALCFCVLSSKAKSVFTIWICQTNTNLVRLVHICNCLM